METLARQMLDVIDRCGWIQYSFSGPNGVCLSGALNRTDETTRLAEVDVMLGTMVSVIKEQFYYRLHPHTVYQRGWPIDACRPGGLVVRFNDHPDTTIEDVRMVLEKTDLKLQEMI